MKRSSAAIVLFVLLPVFSSATTLFADAPAFQEQPDGITLAVGGKRIELQVASAHTFCLRIHEEGAAVRTGSIYLSGQTQTKPAHKIFEEGSTVGIETEFGKLLVDPVRQMWSLRDAAGAVLADWASLGNAKADQPAKSAAFQIAVGPCPKTPHALFYGSGNNPDCGALTQRKGNSATGNGTAMLPQYWSTAGYGVLVVGADDNAPASWKADDSAGGVNWEVPGTGGADLYLCPAADLYAWLRADAELTGLAPVPARWTFGYMQSRWGWKDKAYIDDTLAHFRQAKLPVDTFIVDFEWYTTQPDYSVKPSGEPNFVDFGWNPALFPDPAGQIAEFAKQGLRLVGIRKPRLGNTGLLDSARDKGWILPANPRDPNDGAIRTRNLDFSRREVREWWAENNRKFLDAGMAGFWNDEGETNYIEYSYWNTAELALEQAARPGKRFWSLSRSFIPGMQRFGAAVWTGDIASDWKTLARTPGELLSYSLSGMPYSTCDIGGYSGNPSPELMTRWMQAGVFFPVMRAHSEHNKTPRFPWLFGAEAEAAIRKALELRYRLIPYYYSLSHENSATAAPLMRPLVMEFPNDERAATLADEWLMGTGLLAAPLLNEGGARSVYLPKDRWFHFGSGAAVDGPQTVPLTAKLDEIPMYVRAGTLLPLGPVVQHTGEVSAEPLELQIYPGRDAGFDFVEDDGETAIKGTSGTRRTRFSWNERTRTLSWKVTGGYAGGNVFREVTCVLFASPEAAVKQTALGKEGSIVFP